MSFAESPLHERMVFNVGARRSGTYWLQRIVASHPEISAVPSETMLFSHGVAPLFERFQHAARSSTQVGAVYVERGPVVDAARHLCDVAMQTHLEPGRRYLAERTPTHVFHLQLIAELYPDSRVVHIIRDGRDVARSLVAQPWGPDTIPDAAEEWRSSIEAARSAGLPSERYREVRYEDLEADPEPAIAGLFEWLELPVSGPVLERALAEAAKERNVDRFGQAGIAAGKWRTSLTREDLEAFERVAGSLLAELGYEPSGLGAAAPGAAPPGRAPRLPRLRARLARLRRPARTGRGPTLLAPRQRLADRALEALRTGRVQTLEPLLDPHAEVRVISGSRTEEARGTAGLELLGRTVANDPALSGRQVRGDTYHGGSGVAYMLSFAAGGGHLGDRAVFITTDGESVTEIVMYLPPAAGGHRARTPPSR